MCGVSVGVMLCVDVGGCGCVCVYVFVGVCTRCHFCVCYHQARQLPLLLYPLPVSWFRWNRRHGCLFIVFIVFKFEVNLVLCPLFLVVCLVSRQNCKQDKEVASFFIKELRPNPK